MFYHLLPPLADDWIVFNLFRYVTVRMAGAAVCAFAIMAVVTPWFIGQLAEGRVTEKVHKSDSDRLAQLHSTKSTTPTMGGLLMVLAVVGSCLLWCRLDTAPLLVLLGAVTALTAVGFVDDYVKLTDRSRPGLRPRSKMALQVAVGLAAGGALYGTLEARVLPPLELNQLFLSVEQPLSDPTGVIGGAAASARPDPTGAIGGAAAADSLSLAPRSPVDVSTALCFPFLKRLRLPLGVAFALLACLVVVASSNAVNLTDGLDGLATGCLLLVAVTYMVLGYVAGRVDFAAYLRIPYVPSGGEVAVFCAACTGGLLGFLWFNCHPAQVFMGDTGALALGGAMGAVAVVLKQEILLLLAGGVFVAEALSVMLQVGSFRYRGGRRVFRIAPLHHHYQFGGLSESKITVRFWIVGVLLAGASLATLKLR